MNPRAPGDPIPTLRLPLREDRYGDTVQYLAERGPVWAQHIVQCLDHSNLTFWCFEGSPSCWPRIRALANVSASGLRRSVKPKMVFADRFAVVPDEYFNDPAAHAGSIPA